MSLCGQHASRARLTTWLDLCCPSSTICLHTVSMTSKSDHWRFFFSLFKKQSHWVIGVLGWTCDRGSHQFLPRARTQTLHQDMPGVCVSPWCFRSSLVGSPCAGTSITTGGGTSSRPINARSIFSGSSSTGASNIGTATSDCRTKMSSTDSPSNWRKLRVPVWMNVSVPLSINRRALRIGRCTSTTVKPIGSSSAWHWKLTIFWPLCFNSSPVP